MAERKRKYEPGRNTWGHVFPEDERCIIYEQEEEDGDDGEGKEREGDLREDYERPRHRRERAPGERQRRER